MQIGSNEWQRRWLVSAPILLLPCMASIFLNIIHSGGTFNWLSDRHLCCVIVFFAERAPPMISIGVCPWAVNFLANSGRSIVILGGVLISILIYVIMPHQTASGFAPSSLVWADWSNQTGYTSSGSCSSQVCNGAYAVGTPD